MKIVLFNLAHIVIAMVILIPILFGSLYLFIKTEEYFRNLEVPDTDEPALNNETTKTEKQ